MINSTYKKPFFTSAPSAEAYLGDLRADGTIPLTANWPMGAFTLSQATWQGVAIAAPYGGTGQTVYAVGDLLYASTTSALSKLADVAVGQVLVSGGVGVAPAWSGTPSVASLVLTGTGTLTSTAGNATFTTALTAASGNEIALALNYTTNKAAGNDTGLVVNQTDTASPGTSNLFDFKVANVSKIYGNNTGQLFAIYGVHTPVLDNTGLSITSRGGNMLFTCGYAAAAYYSFSNYGDASGAFTNTSGTNSYVRINPIYNQATGTAANTDLLINRTETAIGSGTQRLISAGAGGGTYVEKFGVDNTGLAYSTPIAITAGSGTGLIVNSTGNLNRQVYKVTVTYAGFSAAATTADKTIATLPAKTKIVGFYADTTVAFTGGAVSAASLTVGKSAGGVEYIATHDVLSAAIVRGLADADMGTELTRAAAIQGGAVVDWAATTTVSARITTTSANTNALTAGSITFYIVTERY